MVRVRWAGAIFGTVQVVTFYRPYPPGVFRVALGVVAFLLLGNLVSWLALTRVRSDRAVRWLSLATMALDFVVVMGFVFVYTFDPDTAIWALMYILPLGGAIRFQSAGAMWSMAAIAIAYALRELYGASAFGNDLLWTSITFRTGIGFIIAGVAGATASGLVREQKAAARRAEQIAQASALLREAQALARMGSWEWELATGRIGWSPEMYRLHGYENDDFEVSLESMLDKIIPEDRTLIRRAIQEMQRTQRWGPAALDYRVNCGEGKFRTLRLRANLIAGGLAAPARLVATVQDVTSRLEAEKTNRRLATIVESSQDAIFAISLEGMIRDWNPSAEIMYGYPAEEVIGQPIEILEPPQLEGEAHGPASIRPGAAIRGLETSQLRKNGASIEVSLTISPLNDSHGRLEGASIIARDITETKRAEERLRRSEQRFRKVFEEGPLGMSFVDRDLKFIDVNEALSHILGHKRRELTTMTLLDITHPEDRPRNGEFAGRLFAGELSGYQLEKRFITKRGETRWVNLTSTLIGEGEKPALGLILVDDVTARKLGEMELEGANQQLRLVNDALREFVANATHDIRSPVTAITGFSDLLTTRWPDLSDGERREFVGAIDRQSVQLLRLIKDLLTSTSMDSGALETNPEVLNVRDAVIEATEYYGREREIQIEIPPHFTVLCDRAHLHRIIANYVANAVKYGAPPFIVEASGLKEWIEIRVRDHGEGVSPDLASRVFQKFTRGDSTQVRAQAGSGLGLSIVKGLAENNGGEAWYETGQLGGACFIVRFPRASAELGHLSA